MDGSGIELRVIVRHGEKEDEISAVSLKLSHDVHLRACVWHFDVGGVPVVDIVHSIDFAIISDVDQEKVHVCDETWLEFFRVDLEVQVEF
jgi:hypothetical protein